MKGGESADNSYRGALGKGEAKLGQVLEVNWGCAKTLKKMIRDTLIKAYRQGKKAGIQCQ